MSNSKQGVMLAGMRKICLKLPQVDEVELKGTPAFKAGEQTFVQIGENQKPLGPTVSFHLGADADALAQDGRFAAGQKGWLTLALYDTDWEELQELATKSYEGIATEAMLEELEALKPSAIPAELL